MSAALWILVAVVAVYVLSWILGWVTARMYVARLTTTGCLASVVTRPWWVGYETTLSMGDTLRVRTGPW